MERNEVISIPLCVSLLAPLLCTPSLLQLRFIIRELAEFAPPVIPSSFS